MTESWDNPQNSQKYVNHSQATRKLRKGTKLTKQSINVAQFKVTLQKNAQTRKLIKFLQSTLRK